MIDLWLSVEPYAQPVLNHGLFFFCGWLGGLEFGGFVKHQLGLD